MFRVFKGFGSAAADIVSHPVSRMVVSVIVLVLVLTPSPGRPEPLILEGTRPATEQEVEAKKKKVHEDGVKELSRILSENAEKARNER